MENPKRRADVIFTKIPDLQNGQCKEENIRVHYLVKVRADQNFYGWLRLIGG